MLKSCSFELIIELLLPKLHAYLFFFNVKELILEAETRIDKIF